MQLNSSGINPVVVNCSNVHRHAPVYKCQQRLRKTLVIVRLNSTQSILVQEHTSVSSDVPASVNFCSRINGNSQKMEQGTDTLIKVPIHSARHQVLNKMLSRNKLNHAAEICKVV